MQTSTDNEEYEVSLLATWLKSLKQNSFATSMHVRVGLAIYGILLPVICNFYTAYGAPFPAEWQSGKLHDKLSFVLAGECGWYVFPLLIFAMICMGKLVRDETKAVSTPWVRIGIFSGVFVFGWYLFAFTLNPFLAISLLLGGALWLLVVHGCMGFLYFLFFHHDPVIVSAITFFGTIILVLLTTIFAAQGHIFVIVGFLMIVAIPVAFIAYLGMSVRILLLHMPARRFTLSQMMIWVTWFGAFMSALKKTIELSYVKYSQLPLTPPDDCYVTTAASKGYPCIVRSQSLPTATNQPMIVNQQLAIFKATELTLRVISPTGHRGFRIIYDHLGPLAAARLNGPLTATMAYLCLKPAQWLCQITLRILLGRQTYQLAINLYRARAKAVELSRFQES